MSQDETRDWALLRYERELERGGRDPKDVGAELLKTERGRYSILCSMPIPGMRSIAVNVQVGDGDSSRMIASMWQTPIERIEDLLAVIGFGHEHVDVRESAYGGNDLVATIFDAKESKAIGDLVLTYRRPFGGVRVWRRAPADPVPEAAPASGGVPSPPPTCRYCGGRLILWADSMFPMSVPQCCRDCAHNHRHLRNEDGSCQCGEAHIDNSCASCFGHSVHEAAGDAPLVHSCTWPDGGNPCGCHLNHNHHPRCKLRRAMGPVAVACEHGRDVCPECDRCNCAEIMESDGLCRTCFVHELQYTGTRAPSHVCAGTVETPCLCSCNDES